MDPDQTHQPDANRWGILQPLGEALRFLTILPIPGLPALDESAIMHALAAFPLAGLLLGLATVAVGWVGDWIGGPLLRAIMVVAAGALLTAGLHLDGVADSCDALFSWRSRERMLEIMKDSRIGTMGALGLLVVVALKTAALAGLGERWWIGAMLAPVWGRWALLDGLNWFPAAAGSGMGKAFHDNLRRRDFWLASLLAVLLSMTIWWPWGLLPALVCAPLVHMLAGRISRTLGGLTGDTYGALAEVGEVLVLLALLALQRHGW